MRILRWFMIASTLGASCSASIIVNGDFEARADTLGLFHSINLNSLCPAQWDIYGSIPGWTTSSRAGIELQSDTIVPAHSGTNYVELDSDITSLSTQTNSGMMQTVTLAPGNYLLRFWYRPRTNVENDNGILAGVGNLTSILADSTNSQMPDWTVFTAPFTVTEAGFYDVTFQATGLQNGVGGFIDDVSLAAVVPEPATLVLLGVGLIGLGVVRRRIRN